MATACIAISLCFWKLALANDYFNKIHEHNSTAIILTCTVLSFIKSFAIYYLLNEITNEKQIGAKQEIIELLEAAEKAQSKAKPTDVQLPLSNTSKVKEEAKDDNISPPSEHTAKDESSESKSSISEAREEVKNNLIATFNPQPSSFVISPKIIKQLKAKKQRCDITFFIFVLISTPSYFYIRLKT